MSEKAINILFGEDNIIELPDKTVIQQWLKDYRFDVTQANEISPQLAELSELWSGLSCKFKYTDSSAPSPSCNSVLWCKPILLHNFLTMVADRGYTHMRLGMHGSNDDGYEDMQRDPMCFNMRKAGKNGMAHGNGLYFGLSDQVPIRSVSVTTNAAAPSTMTARRFSR